MSTIWSHNHFQKITLRRLRFRGDSFARREIASKRHTSSIEIQLEPLSIRSYNKRRLMDSPWDEMVDKLVG